MIEKYGEFVGKGSFNGRCILVFVVTAATVVPRRGEFSAEHAIKPDQDEGNGKQLPLIDANQALHVEFPGLLHLFEELYAETEGKNERETETKKESGTDFLAMTAINEPTDEQKHKISDGFVELGGVSGLRLAKTSKDEAEIAVRVGAYDLRVHEIAQTDAARGDRGGDGDVIQHA